MRFMVPEMAEMMMRSTPRKAKPRSFLVFTLDDDDLVADCFEVLFWLGVEGERLL